jgi:PAS domain S-box-containing protein
MTGTAAAPEPHDPATAASPGSAAQPGAPDPRLPGLGSARAAMLEIHRTLGAAHTAVFVFDADGGVLHLVDQAVATPPIDDFWSRIFIDEDLPLTEAVCTGRPTDGGFSAMDQTLLRYAGISVAAPGLGRLVCFPLVTGDGRTTGVVYTDNCATPDRIGRVDVLEHRLAEPLGELAEELAATSDVLLTRITESVYGLREAGGQDRAARDAPDPTSIRASISCGTFWWRLRESVIHLDPVAMGALGSGDGQGYTGSPLPLLARIHRDDYPLVRRTMARALAEEGVFALEYRAHTRGGSLHWIEARARVMKDERGEPVMLGILTDTTGSPSWTQLASTQIDAMPDGFAVLDPRLRLVYANESVARLFGLGRAELVGRHLDEVLEPLDPGEWRPRLSAVVHTGEPTSFEVLMPKAGRWYELRATLDAGRVAVHFRDVHEYRERRERERERDARWELAAAFAAALGGTLGVDDVIEVFEQQMPALSEADGVAMHVATGGRLRLIAAVGYSAVGLGGLRVLDLDDPGPMSDAVHECDVQVYESVEEIVGRFPFLARMCEETGTGALLVLPLLYEDACLGLVCVRYDRPRRIGESYLRFVSRRCDQLAQALFRAHRYDEELSLASRLRDAVFDVPLDSMPGLELASEYRSPGLGLAVGGDWYDAIPMARGRIGLLVGDVEGHNARAVGGMSMVRTAIRAFAHEGYGPAAILGRVNKLIAGLDPDLLATCCVAELDPGVGTARIARAGHPSPVLSLADGAAGLLELPAGLPLGVDPDETYRSVLTPMPPGALLALYSDGLVESRSLPIDQGTDRLVEALRGHARTAVGDLARNVVGDRFDQPGLGDDLTLLLARRIG